MAQRPLSGDLLCCRLFTLQTIDFIFTFSDHRCQSRMNWSYLLIAILTVAVSILLHQYYTLKNIIRLQSDKTEGNKSHNLQSAVYCHGQDMFNKICHFHNICYFPKEEQFVFFVGKGSVKGNIDKHLGGGHFLALSSVHDLDGLMFSMSELPSNVSGDFDIEWIRETTIILSRFKPDNIMHVLHDDVIPLHYTLHLLLPKTNKKGRYGVRLLFMDDFDAHHSEMLYKIFSLYPIMHKVNLVKHFHNKLLCFNDAYAGLSRYTTWYQYGFKTPQGPIQNKILTSEIIQNTVKYIDESLRCADYTPLVVDGNYLVLFSRKENRLILNENELKMEIMKTTKMKIVSVSFEDQTLCEMIQLVKKSRGLVGMHGSSLILSMFLKPTSILVELFPYAVNPAHYTPYKTLLGIDGMQVVYRAWQNLDKNSSTGFPNREKIEGGISHLSHDEQKEIMDQSEVPLHLCCDNASWLYHIYQDTIVDVKEVANLCKSAFTEAKNIKVNLKYHNLVLGSVTNLTCYTSQCLNGKSSLNLRWKKPWNTPYLQIREFYYYVLVQQIGSSSPVSYGAKLENFVVSKDIQCHTQYDVWVRLLEDGNTRKGPFQYVMCRT